MYSVLNVDGAMAARFDCYVLKNDCGHCCVAFRVRGCVQLDVTDPEGFVDGTGWRRNKPIVMRWQPKVGAAAEANYSRVKIWYIVFSAFWLPIAGCLALIGAASD